MRGRALGGLVAAATLAGGAHAAATTFAGTLDLRAGYGNNPYLGIGNSGGGTGQVGGTLSAGLTSRTSRSTTTLTGVVDIVQSFNNYGRSENYTVALNRSQQLSARLSIDAGIGYANTINPGASYQSTLVTGAILPGGVLAPTTAASAADVAAANAAAAPIGTAPLTTVPIGTFDPSNLDLYTIGQRSERYSGNLGLSWTATSRDQFTLAGSASRIRYRNFAGNYTQYGGSATYLHTLSVRTQVGLSGNYNYVSSENYPGARSYGANVLLNQQLGQHWRANIGVGLILPRGGVGQSDNLTLGFNGSLCGDLQRANICFTAARQSAPTGIGGLRTDLQAGFTLGYALTEHDRLNAAVTVDHSQGNSIVPKQDFYQASAGFSHDLGRRIAIGGSGRVQRRSGSGIFASATSYAVTVDVITRFGNGS